MIGFRCTNCEQPVHEDQAGEHGWLRTATGASACAEGGTAAYPDPELLYADAVAALDARYELVYVDYRETLREAQVQVLLAGENPWESKEFSWLWESESDNRAQGGDYVLENLLAGDERDLLEATSRSPGCSLLDELLAEIYERDESDIVGELLRHTGSLLFRYDLDHEVAPYPWLEEESELHRRAREIAEVLGVDFVDNYPKLSSLVTEASYGGQLFAYFYGSVEEALALADPNDPYAKRVTAEPMPELAEPTTVTFARKAHIVVLDRLNGSGSEIELESVTVPWRKRAVAVDHGPYSWDGICGLHKPAYSTEITYHYDKEQAHA